MIQDSYREPSESLQTLSECLCDKENNPLLYDPSLKDVSLCYKALPNYEAFVQKRGERVKRRNEIEERQCKDQIDHEIFLVLFPVR